MSKLKIGLTLLFSAIGVFGVNEYYKPRNVRDLLKWQGVQLSSDGNVWKSMFFEHKEELLKKNINSDTELWKWCEERFNSSNLGDTGIVEDARKYCSDNPISIRGRIIREGEEKRIIEQSNTEAFKVNYLLASNKAEINKLIGISEYQNNLEEGSKKLQEYCKNQEKTKILTLNDKDKLSTFKKRCYDLKVKNFTQLLDKLGRKPMTKPKQFQKRFNDEKLKQSKELKEKIMGLLKGEEPDKKVWKQKFRGILNTSVRKDNRALYKKWQANDQDTSQEEKFLFDNYGWMIFRSLCQEQLKTSLLEKNENMSLDSFSKFNSRCSVEK